MPVPTVAKTQLIIDFLVANGWDNTSETGWYLAPGPEILTSPDKIVTITPTSGPGYVTEEAGLDNWGFQARVRGTATDTLSPELAAQQLDYLILSASYPQNVDGVNIQLAYRSGSPPVPLPFNPADLRFEYTCTYLIITQTGA